MAMLPGKAQFTQLEDGFTTKSDGRELRNDDWIDSDLGGGAASVQASRITPVMLRTSRGRSSRAVELFEIARLCRRLGATFSCEIVRSFDAHASLIYTDVMVDKGRLLDMPRRQLQDLAKANNIRANLKSSEIVKSLLAIEGPIRGLQEGNPDSDHEEAVGSDQAGTEIRDDSDKVEKQSQDEVSVVKRSPRAKEPKLTEIQDDSDRVEEECHDEVPVVKPSPHANEPQSAEIQDDSDRVEEKCRDEVPVVKPSPHANEPESATGPNQVVGSPVRNSSPRSDNEVGLENAQDGPEITTDEPDNAAVEAEGVSDIPEEEPEIVPERVSVGDDGRLIAEIASENANCAMVNDVSYSKLSETSTAMSIPGVTVTQVEQTLECITVKNVVHMQGPDPESQMILGKTRSESDLMEPSSESAALSSDHVQDALDTYRKIAMQSNAELDAHGCDIPELPSSGKFASADATRKQQLPAVAAPKEAASKGDSGSVRNTKSKFDLQESLSRPISWEMKKGPLPPVSVQVLEDPNRLCLWSPSRMAERKKEYKNNDFGGTKRRLEGYMADGRAKLNETVRDLRKAADSTAVEDE